MDLLVALGQERNLVRACEHLGITRDRGLYSLRRLKRIAGGDVVLTSRGGDGGSTRLTALGRRLMRAGAGVTTPSARESTVLSGRWHSTPEPCVIIPGGTCLKVGFSANEGERVTIAVDPEAIIVGLDNFRTSARNVLRATIESIRTGSGTPRLACRVGTHSFGVAVTRQSLDTMGLHEGLRIWLYLKATAVHRLGAAARPEEPIPKPRARRAG